MGEKIIGVAAAIVTATAAVAIITHPRTATTARALGSVFIGSLRQIRGAAGR